MNFEFILTSDFEKSVKRLNKKYSSFKNDLSEFLKSLRENPFQGDILIPGVRKIRLQIKSKGKGKSGGARVITYTVVISELEGQIYLLDIYDKNDSESVDHEILKKMVFDLENGNNN